MTERKTMKRVLVGAAAALALVLAVTLVVPMSASAFGGKLGGFGHGGFGHGGGADRGAQLADALGISVEELQAAQEKAALAGLAQALDEGLITEEEVLTHPMRNYVECCLGGDAVLPEMTISGRHRLEPGDLLMACSDGLWSGVSEDDIGALGGLADGELEQGLEALAQRAVDANGPYSDNTTITALRWRG